MAARVAGDSNGSELRAGSITDGGAGLVPVEVPLEELVVGGVDLSALDTLGDGGAVVAAGDLDVEGLGPELAVGDGAVVVDGGDLGAQDVVAGGDGAGDGDGVGVAVVVEDGVGAPLASLALGSSLSVASALGVASKSDLVNLEELELRLVDLGAVAVAGGEPGGSPAVVGAVPALLTVTAASLVMPVESDLGAGRGLGGVGRRSSVFVGDDVGLVDGVTHHRLPAPALVGLPRRGALLKGSIDGSTTEAGVGLATNLGALDGSVAGDLGNEAREENSSVEDLGHVDVVLVGICFG